MTRVKGVGQEKFAALSVYRITSCRKSFNPARGLGNLLPGVCDETGLGETPVIAPGTHDTASAVAAVPARAENWAYISSGTWSLMGIEVNDPIISDQVLRLNFTNEGGVADTFRFLKNIMGLWAAPGMPTGHGRGEVMTCPTISLCNSRRVPSRSGR